MTHLIHPNQEAAGTEGTVVEVDLLINSTQEMTVIVMAHQIERAETTSISLKDATTKTTKCPNQIIIKMRIATMSVRPQCDAIGVTSKVNHQGEEVTTVALLLTNTTIEAMVQIALTTATTTINQNIRPCTMIGTTTRHQCVAAIGTTTGDRMIMTALTHHNTRAAHQ